MRRRASLLVCGGALRWPWFALSAVLLAAVPPWGGLEAQGNPTHLLVVVGLGGEPEYRKAFHELAVQLVTAAKEEWGVPADQVTYLGELPEEAPAIIEGRSTVENVAGAVARIAGRARPDDQVLIVLVGHGTGSGTDARFNLPGPDLTPSALGVMLEDLAQQRVAVVNTSSSSGPFLQALSAPGRVIITATRTALERNETQFGRFFVEALAGEEADLDKDGGVSLLEAFTFATDAVERYYREHNLLATEHAQLDDDGDGVGITAGELLESGGADEGRLASAFLLAPAAGPGGLGATAADTVSDPTLRRLLAEKAELERRIAELRALRGRMEEARYEKELEELLVQLALKNREIRAHGGGDRR